MAQYKNTGGIHSGPGEEGKRYPKGSVIESSVDLAALFPKQFQRVGTQTVADEPVESPPEPAPAPKVDPDRPAAVKPIEYELGENVTGDFADDIGDKKVMVFKDGSRYWVSRKETPNEAVNEKAVKKAEVADIIASCDDTGAENEAE